MEANTDTAAPCRHCGQETGPTGRAGFCWDCYFSPAVRRLYWRPKGEAPAKKRPRATEDRPAKKRARAARRGLALAARAAPGVRYEKAARGWVATVPGGECLGLFPSVWQANAAVARARREGGPA